MSLIPRFLSPVPEDRATPIYNALKRAHEIDIGDPFEAFSHACETWRRYEGTDRAAVGLYIDMILDKYLEDSNGV